MASPASAAVPTKGAYLFLIDVETTGRDVLQHQVVAVGFACINLANGTYIADERYVTAAELTAWEPRCLAEFWNVSDGAKDVRRICGDARDPRVRSAAAVAAWLHVAMHSMNGNKRESTMAALLNPRVRAPRSYPHGSLTPVVFDAFLAPLPADSSPPPPPLLPSALLGSEGGGAPPFAPVAAASSCALWLVGTWYSRSGPDSARGLTASVNGVPLVLTEVSTRTYEPSRAWRAIVPQCASLFVTLRADGLAEETVEATPLAPLPGGGAANGGGSPPVLALATLFKDDAPWLRRFLAFYRGQGVTAFVLYYNGRTLPRAALDVDAPDIVWGTWPYSYWNPDNADEPSVLHHVAQVAFLTLVRHGVLPHAERTLLADLDEFIMPRARGVTLVRALTKYARAAVVQVANTWARTDGEYALRVSTEPVQWKLRTKCVYPAAFSGLLGIHGPKDGVVVRDNDALAMFHVVDVCHPERRTRLVEPTARVILDWGAAARAGDADAEATGSGGVYLPDPPPPEDVRAVRRRAPAAPVLPLAVATVGLVVLLALAATLLGRPPPAPPHRPLLSNS